jgi:hypothetical protein
MIHVVEHWVDDELLCAGASNGLHKSPSMNVLYDSVSAAALITFALYAASSAGPASSVKRDFRLFSHLSPKKEGEKIPGVFCASCVVIVRLISRQLSPHSDEPMPRKHNPSIRAKSCGRAG